MNQPPQSSADDSTPVDPSEDGGDDSQSSAAPPIQQIRLDQFLQACGVPTGGQAKRLIQGGEVLVNGEVETRRRKKLVEGDEVSFDGEVFEVVLAADGE